MTIEAGSEPWREAVKGLFPLAKFDEPLRLHTTFRIGGPADCYLEVQTREQLRGLFKVVREFKIPVFMFGWGSNLLVRDGGIRGLVLRLRGDFEKLEFLENSRVRAGAGLRVPQLAALCAEKSLAGGESLVGVPGTIGGALVMNAGTRDGEIGPLVREVEIFDVNALSESILPAARLSFEYRRSNLGEKIILGCVLELKPGDKVDIIRRIQGYQLKRLKTQPIHTYNVGSIFKNPTGKFVAKLIEEAGLKGSVRGGARISPMHANFIENFSDATAADVLELVQLAREKVKAASGLDLELEMKVVGRES